MPALITLTLPGNIDIVVPPNLSCLTTYVLLEQEDWFEYEISFVRSCLPPGINVLDVGANFGVYSLTAASCIGPAGHVWAIEPASSTAEYLKESARRHPCHNISVIQAAISSKNGTAFLAFGQSEESHHLSSTQEITHTNNGGEDVATITLDTLQEQYALPQIDFLKLDAEGHEEEILAGGHNFFQRHKPLIMLEIANSSKREMGVLDQFLAWGYQSFILLPSLNALVPVSRDTVMRTGVLNVFVIHPDAIPKWASNGAIIEPPQSSPQAVELEILWQYWQQHAWAKPFIESWTTWPDRSWLCILAMLLHAEDKTLPKELRYGFLIEAQTALHAVPTTERHIGHHLALMRLCILMGNRIELISQTTLVGQYWHNMPINPLIPPMIMAYDAIMGDNIFEVCSLLALHAKNNYGKMSTIYDQAFAVQFGTVFQHSPSYTVADERRFLLSSTLQTTSIPVPWPASDALKNQTTHADIWNNRVLLSY